MYIISSKKEENIKEHIEEPITEHTDKSEYSDRPEYSENPASTDKSAAPDNTDSGRLNNLNNYIYKDRYTVSGGELGGTELREAGTRRNGSIAHYLSGISDVSKKPETRFRRHTRSPFREVSSVGRSFPHDGYYGPFDGRRLSGRRNNKSDTAVLVIIAFFVIGFVTGCAVWNTDGARQQCSVFVERYMSFARGSGFFDCLGAGVAQQLPALIAIAMSAFFVAGFVACPVIVFVRGMGTAMVICSLFSGLSRVTAPAMQVGVTSSGDIMLSSGTVMQGEGTVSGSALGGHMIGSMIGTGAFSEHNGIFGAAAAVLYIALTTAILIKAASDAAGVSSDISSRGTVKRYGGFILRAVLYALALTAVSALHAGAVLLLK